MGEAKHKPAVARSTRRRALCWAFLTVLGQATASRQQEERRDYHFGSRIRMRRSLQEGEEHHIDTTLGIKETWEGDHWEVELQDGQEDGAQGSFSLGTSFDPLGIDAEGGDAVAVTDGEEEEEDADGETRLPRGR